MDGGIHSGVFVDVCLSRKLQNFLFPTRKTA